MLAVLLLLCTWWVGKNILRVVPLRLFHLEYLSLAYLLGLLLTTWSIFLSSLALGYTYGIPFGVGLPLFVSWLLAKRYATQHSKWDSFTTLGAKLSTALFGIFWVVILAWLLIHHSFSVQPGGWYSGGNTWGDLALHSTFIYAFSENTHPVLQFPIYPDLPLTYPFLFDFYTAMLVKTGATIQFALVSSSLFTITSSLFLGFFLLWRVTKSSFISALGMSLFLLNSSVGSWQFVSDWQLSGLPLLEFLAALPTNYVHVEVSNLHIMQVIIDMVLPQRGFTAGIGIFFVLCLAFYQLLELNTKSKPGKSVSITSAKTAAITTEANFIRYLFVFSLGLLPLFHIHTFLVGMGIWGWYLLTELHHCKYDWKQFFQRWLKPILVFSLLATPQLIWQFGHTFGAGFLTIQFGWMSGEQNILVFWLRNLGLELLLAGAGCWYLYQKEQHAQLLKILVFPLICLFVLCNILVFQPSIWDNTKFLVYCHWAFIVLAVYSLYKLNHWARQQTKILRVTARVGVLTAVIVLVSGGALAVTREFQLNWLTASQKDLAVAQFVRETIPADAKFLTADTHNHPIPMLTGRPVLLGYRGWLWTYGVDYTLTERAVHAIYMGHASADGLLRENSIKYIFVGEKERAQFSINQEYLDQFSLVYNQNGNRIYQVD